MLFVVAGGDDQKDVSQQDLAARLWEPKSKIVKEALANVEVLELSLAELAMLLADCKIPPLTVKVTDPLRFVILDAEGHVAQFSRGDSVTKLGHVLQKMARESTDDTKKTARKKVRR